MLFVAVGGLAGLILMLALLRVPAVQLRILRWVSAGGGGVWRFDAQRVSVGPGGGEASGLEFAMPGLAAQMAPAAVVQLRPARFLFAGRELNVARANAEAIKIIITPAELKGGGAPTVFAGLLTALRSPVPWALGDARVGLEVEVREAGAAMASARLTVNGGGLSATRAGEFTYEFEMASRLLPPGPDSMVRSRGTVSIRQNGSHGVGGIDLRGDLRLPAYGGLTPPPGTLRLGIEETPDGERYTGEVRFGEAAQVGLAAHFDSAKRTLTGRLDLAADTRLLATLPPPADMSAWPEARTSGGVDFSLALDDAKATARIHLDGEASAFERARPELAAIGKMRGEFNAKLVRTTLAEGWKAVEARLTAGAVGGEEHLVCVAEDARTLRVSLHALPLTAAQPWLKALGIDLSGATANGEWRLTHTGGHGGRLETVRPLTLGPLQIADGRTPALPAMQASLALGADGTPEEIRWTLDALRLTGADEAGYAGQVSAGGTWSFAGAGGGRVDTAKVRLETMAGNGSATPFLLELTRPLQLSASGEPQIGAPGELAKVTVRALPLDALTRWLPGGRVLRGVVTEADATLTATDTKGGLALRTESPWRFSGLRLTEADGKPLWSGDVALQPDGSRSEGKIAGKMLSLQIRDEQGRELRGEIGGDWTEATGAYAATVDLRAKLPAGSTPAPADWGALDARLSFKTGTAAPTVGQVDEFVFELKNADGERASLRSAGAWLFASRPNSEVIVSSLAPWVLKTGRLSLASLRDLMPAGLEMTGELAPTEFLVVAEPNALRLRPTQPLAVSGLRASQDGRELARDVAASFFAGMDTKIYHTRRPTFQIAWEATLNATDGKVETSGGGAVGFEGAFGISGDAKVVLPHSVDFIAKVDLAALRAGFPSASPQLPKSGRLTARLNGDMLGGAPFETWLRVEDVPASDGQRMLAPIELTAHGKVDGRAKICDIDAALRMGDGAAAGDLAFGAKFALGDDTLRIDSTLHGKAWDLGETQAWSQACGVGGGPPVPASPGASAGSPASRAASSAAAAPSSAGRGTLRRSRRARAPSAGSAAASPSHQASAANSAGAPSAGTRGPAATTRIALRSARSAATSAG